MSYEEGEQVISFETNIGDVFTLDGNHPIQVEINPKTGEPKPYVLVRSNLEGLISRNIYYKLIEISELKKIATKEVLVLRSHKKDFEIGYL